MPNSSSQSRARFGTTPAALAAGANPGAGCSARVATDLDRSGRLRQRLFFIAVALSPFGLSACDTGFGQPCSLPKTAEIRAACEASDSSDEVVEGVQVKSKASCAVKNYASCETRVCLVYRGSDSFCSEPCFADKDCEGSARCRPLIGDVDVADIADLCTPTEGQQFTPECFCVRGKDLSN